MSELQTVKVPDIGDVDDVEVIEVLVSVGDTVDVETSLVTVESDKASMEIPSPAAGVITSMHVQTGDRVSEGSDLLVLDVASSAEPASKGSDKSDGPAGSSADSSGIASTTASASAAASAGSAANAPDLVVIPQPFVQPISA